MLDQLLTLLNKLREEHEADGVKVYFQSETSYTIKIIKGGEIIKVYRNHEKRKDKSWDLKQ